MVDLFEIGSLAVGGATLVVVIWLHRQGDANADRRAEKARLERLVERERERDALLHQYITLGGTALEAINAQFYEWERMLGGPDAQNQVVSGMVSRALSRLRREIEPLGYGPGFDVETRLAIGRLLDATANPQQWTGLRGPRIWLAASVPARDELDQGLAILRSKLTQDEPEF